MNKEFLRSTAIDMVQKGKGILAADESSPTCTKRFENIGIESNELNRNKYRDMLFTTSNIEKFISGVILFDETLRQSTIKDQIPFPEYLKKIGVLVGIKVDKGVKVLASHNGEKITEGLDGLRERLDEYYTLGARFAKWRAVITIGEGIPTDTCIHVNAHALARYAALCQEANIVPIVEPEVLMDGHHSIDLCYDVSYKTFTKVFQELKKQNVYLEGIVLKPNMIVSGTSCSEQANFEEVAFRTMECLKATVPEDVPGCAFLSGGQSNQNATMHLNLLNAKYSSELPWNLTFSYGRALQSSSLNKWLGEDNNMNDAQIEFYKRAKLNSLASQGAYSESLEI
jgi:fructose-bisphosphate aldolase class I